MKIFVTYDDYQSDEGCSSPHAVYLTEAEAETSRPKNDWGSYTIAEFEIDDAAILGTLRVKVE